MREVYACDDIMVNFWHNPPYTEMVWENCMKQLETSRSIVCQRLVIWLSFPLRVPIFTRQIAQTPSLHLSLHCKDRKFHPSFDAFLKIQLLVVNICMFNCYTGFQHHWKLENGMYAFPIPAKISEFRKKAKIIKSVMKTTTPLVCIILLDCHVIYFCCVWTSTR